MTPPRIDPDLRSQLLQMSAVLGEIGAIIGLMADDLYKALERDRGAHNGKSSETGLKWPVDAN